MRKIRGGGNYASKYSIPTTITRPRQLCFTVLTSETSEGLHNWRVLQRMLADKCRRDAVKFTACLEQIRWKT